MQPEFKPFDGLALLHELASLAASSAPDESFLAAALDLIRDRCVLRTAVLVRPGAGAAAAADSTVARLEVPLEAARQNIGMLLVERDGAPFSPDESEWLAVVSVLLALAVRGGELSGALQDARGALEDAASAFESERMLGAVNQELTAILDLDPLLDRIAAILRDFIDYELFALLLVDEERQELIWKTAIGYTEESHRELERLGLGEGVVGRAVKTRLPIVVEDVALEPDYRPARTASGKVPASELVMPLLAKGRVIGALVLESTQPAYFGPRHLRLLEPLASRIASAIENASLYEGAHRDALTKEMMSGIGKEMTHILDLDDLLNRIAVLMRRVIAYEILGISVYHPETERLELKVAIGYDDVTVDRIRDLRLGEGLLGHAARDRATVVSADLEHDPRAIPARTVDGRATRSEVAIPLVFRDRLLGAFMVESCDPRYFSSERVQILETLASQMAVSIHNAQLFHDVLQKEQKLEADFQLARDLQSSMLPVSMPEIEGYEVAAVYKPAESLGGDYYDFIWLDKGVLGLAIGDVSGKGVAAAMTMAATRSALRFAARINKSPSQVLYHANRRLYRDVKNRTFVTLFYAVLDLEARVCRWSNAGHHPPILERADGSREELDRGGMVLALFDKARYSCHATTLRAGDVLCCYTDGVVEALNTADEEFGKARLLELVQKKRAGPAREILRHVTGELRKFTRGAPQHDDITLFILKVGEDG